MKSTLNFLSKWQSLLPVTLVALLFLSYDLQRSYLREIEFAQRNNENIARVLDGHLSSCIDRIDLALSAAIFELDYALTSRAPKGVNTRLRQILDKIPESQSLRIVDAKGHVVFDASGDLPKVELADRGYFLRNQNDPNAGLVISEPIFARITNNWVITLSRQFRDSKGRFLGLIQAAIRADYFSNFYHSLDMGPRGLISLMNKDLILFARHPELPEKMGSTLPEGELRIRLLQSIDNGGHYISRSPLDSIQRFAYFRKASANYPFVFVVAAAKDDVFAELYWKAIIYGIFVLLLLGAIYYLISGWRHRHRDALALAEHMSLATQRQTERLTSLINATQVGTWEWNVQTGELIINERWADILGFTLAELQPLSIETLRGRGQTDDLEKSTQLLEQHFSAQTPYYDCEVRLRHKKGHWVWVLIRGQVTRWTGDGQPLWMFGTNQDISTTKALEFSLKDLLQDHERLVQSIPVGVYRYQMPLKGRDRFTYVSPRWCEQMNLTAAEALSNPQKALQRIHPEDQKSFCAALAKARQQRDLFFWEGRLLNGTELKWVRIESTPSLLPNGGVLWNGIQSEVTDRVLARQAQERATALRQALLDNSAVGVFLASWERHIEQVSHRICEMFGYTAEEMIGQSAEIIHVDHAHFQGFALNYSQLSAALSVDLEYPFRHRNGRVFWCAATGTPLDRTDPSKGIVWTFLDIDEKRRLATELENQRRNLSDILNSIPAAVSYWDARDVQNICNVFSNLTYADWYATTPQALVGMHVRDLLGEALYNEHWRLMVRARLGETIVYDRQQPLIEGQPARHAQVHYIADLRDGEPHGIYVMMFDTTRLRESEQAMKQAKELAEEASRAKGDFLANMSHEIRTPMNAVLGLLELLQHTELNRRQRGYAEKARAAAKALLGILNDILDFSKVEAGKLEIENTRLVLDDVLRNLSVVLSAASHNKEVEVLFDLDPSLPKQLRGDPLRLQQVLLNLTGNAVKFTKQGEVVLYLRRQPSSDDSAQICIEFSVQDTGIGIAPDKLERIFEGFTQAEASTSRHYGGTGLGLAISQRLVQLMGGELRVESTQGVGSRFYFSLSLSADSSNTDPEPIYPALKVLVVDDNPQALAILVRMVQAQGWQAHSADTGSEALLCLKSATEQGAPFDVVLLDWVMPGMDGWETASHIRALTDGQAPMVVMITAQDLDLLEQQDDHYHNTDLLDGLLIKPITPLMLQEAVAEAAQGNNKLPNAKDSNGRQRLAGLRLLVVEDNPINQRVAQGLLSHEGAWVEVASDAQRGIDCLREAAEPFDAILMDIQMPGMDGYEATRLLRKTWNPQELPIIAMTANAMPADREECLAAGMNDHVSKPIDLNTLVATLLRHCQRRAEPLKPDAIPAKGTTGLMLELPAMPVGFNLHSALARLDNDTQLYRNLVQTFCLDQRHSIRLLREQLQQGQTREAVRLLHTLKGLAAMLGAEAFAQTAGEAEKGIRSGTQADQHEQLLSTLEEMLDNTLRVMGQVINALSTPTGHAEPISAKPERILELLASLDQLLAEYNMRALDVFATLSEEGRDTLKDNLHPLDEAMRQLDFAAAREKAANLITLITLKNA